MGKVQREKKDEKKGGRGRERGDSNSHAPLMDALRLVLLQQRVQRPALDARVPKGHQLGRKESQEKKDTWGEEGEGARREETKPGLGRRKSWNEKKKKKARTST